MVDMDILNGPDFLSFVDEVVKEEEGHLRQMEARSFRSLARLCIRLDVTRRGGRLDRGMCTRSSNAVTHRWLAVM